MQFTIDKKIGKGLFAEVFSATTIEGETVAVKFFDHGMFPTSRVGSMISDQATALQRISHENIVNILCVIETTHPEKGHKTKALVMEMIDGVTLEDKLLEGLECSSIISIGTQILDGLDAIHSAGLTHGDMHLNNVMIDSEGNVKIIDIMYDTTMAGLNTNAAQYRVDSDLKRTGLLLYDLIRCVGQDLPVTALTFRSKIATATSLESLKQLFISHAMHKPAQAQKNEDTQ